MVLGFAEDFTSNVTLDKGLTKVPSSGLYVNSGVHPSVTVENLLAFLPKLSIDFQAWDSEASYEAFTDSRNRKDVVLHNDKTWRAVKAGTAQEPSPASEYWIETNINSLRIIVFLEKVKDRVLQDLNLNKQLINNQYIYETGDMKTTPGGDYSGWVFEGKGSDYVSLQINSISLQKEGNTPVNLYVVRGNEVIETIEITPGDGHVSFKEVDLTIPLDKLTSLVVESSEVYTSSGVVDPLIFDGFLAYTTTGTGDSPETAKYNYSVMGNGLGFNVTAYLDASKYIDYNLSSLGRFVRSVFEYMTFQMFLSNSNNRANRAQLIQMDEQMLVTELKNKDWNVDTVSSRYHKELKAAKALISKTFDVQLQSANEDGLEIDTHAV